MYKHNCFACIDDSNINFLVTLYPVVTTDKRNYLLSFQSKSLLCHFTMQLSCCSKLIWRHNNWTDYLTHIKTNTNGTKKDVQFITGLRKSNNNYDVITHLFRMVSSSRSLSKCVISSSLHKMLHPVYKTQLPCCMQNKFAVSSYLVNCHYPNVQKSGLICFSKYWSRGFNIRCMTKRWPRKSYGYSSENLCPCSKFFRDRVPD